MEIDTLKIDLEIISVPAGRQIIVIKILTISRACESSDLIKQKLVLEKNFYEP